MKIIGWGLLLIAGVINGVGDAWSWWVGAPATLSTWLFAVLFSVNVALVAIDGLIRSND